MNTSRLVLSILCGLLTCSTALATAQIPEYLRIGDLEYDLYSTPLEPWVRKDNPDPMRFWAAPLMGSSGLSRGYTATWEISNGKLYLVEIDSWFCGPGYEEHPKECRRVTLTDILGPIGAKESQPAKWYTGKLRVPDGRQLLYVHSGFHSVFERDLIYDVKAGQVTGPEIIDNTNKPLPTDQGWVQQSILAKPRKITDPRPKWF